MRVNENSIRQAYVSIIAVSRGNGPLSRHLSAVKTQFLHLRQGRSVFYGRIYYVKLITNDRISRVTCRKVASASEVFNFHSFVLVRSRERACIHRYLIGKEETREAFIVTSKCARLSELLSESHGDQPRNGTHQLRAICRYATTGNDFTCSTRAEQFHPLSSPISSDLLSRFPLLLFSFLPPFFFPRR